VDLRSLNATCLHGPFPTLFSDGVLKNIGGREAYSFIDGFLGNHSIIIVEEDTTKITFTTC
jgi:hypothetical protein